MSRFLDIGDTIKNLEPGQDYGLVEFIRRVNKNIDVHLNYLIFLDKTNYVAWLDNFCVAKRVLTEKRNFFLDISIEHNPGIYITPLYYSRIDTKRELEEPKKFI